MKSLNISLQKWGGKVKITKLALANIKKSKSATISLLIFIMIAALLLNTGLMVITQISSFFDNKVEQLEDPHVTFVMDEATYDTSKEEYARSYPGVTKVETEELINMDIAKFDFGGAELSVNIVIFNANEQREIGQLKLIEKLGTSSENDIYVPYSFKTNAGYELGEQLTINYKNHDYNYKIAGFLETTMMGTNNIGVIKFMLPEIAYANLKDELDTQSDAIVISVIMENLTQSAKFKNNFINKYQRLTEESNSYIWGLDFELVKGVNTLTVNMVATILVAFAIIIVLVSLIVIRFRVTNSIEDGMANIGVLKAIGYTSRQILSSIILQFIIIALSGSVIGIALSYVLMPIFGGIISTLSGLIWIQTLDLIINLISMFLVAFSVLVVSLLSAYRVRKIVPVAALRGGLLTHNFKRNHLPLEKAKGGLHFLLATKSTIANAKQNLMILLIIIALTFASIFSVVLYYNVATDKTAFINLFGSEPANVYIVVKSETDTEVLINDIEQMDHVRKVNILDMIKTEIDDHTVYTNITKQYDELENNIVYEGRQPKYDNEISISWIVSNQINKGIGDTVEVKYGSEASDYIITGLSQAMGNGGTVAALTMEGIQTLYSDYKGWILYVYLDGIANKDFIKNLQEQYGDQIVEVLDIDENIESQTGMYTSAVFAVMVMVFIITVLVVVMILYLVIKTMIIKRKKEFGVMKAIGYSTIQLMNQISISFLPVIITGVAVGGVLGYYFTNAMLSVLLSSAGVKRLEFIIHLPSILILCIGILILSYIVIILVSRRIKNISAYGLISE